MHIARRTERITFMLTQEEKAILYSMARQSKMTVGKYVRSRIFSKKKED